MQFLKKPAMREMLIALAIILVFLAILVFLGLRISKLTATISKNIQEVLDRSASIKLLSVLEDQYASKGERYSQILENAIPSKDALVDLQKEFQSLAAQENVGFGFTFLGETPAGQSNLGAVTYRLNVQGGSLDAIFRFMRRLASFRYLNGLNSVAINKPDANFQAVLNGQAYYR